MRASDLGCVKVKPRSVRLGEDMRTAGLLAAACLGAAAMAGTPAAAQQVKEGSQSGLGITGAEVPPLLKDIKADPYKAPGAPICATVPLEIQQITDLIGPDIDAQNDKETSLVSKGADLARGMVPYRGVVRFVTGANKKDQELHDAVVAGYARRGFLRGIQINLKCHPDGTQAADADASGAKKPGRKKAKGARKS